MRILITGVSGFLGRHLAAELVAAGHEVFGTYHDEDPRLAGVRSWEMALPAAARLDEVFAAARPEAVAHLAALSHVGSSWGRIADYYRVNVSGTEEVLERLGEARCLLASSGEVYGERPEAEQPIREDAEVAPASPYALTKAAAERLVLAQGGVVARLFNMLGPGQAPCFALPAFAGQLAEIAAGRREPILHVGNLEARRDFVHVADGVAALRLLLERGRPGTTYNVATGRADRLGDLLSRLVALTGQEVRVEVDPERLRPVDIPVLSGRADRLRELGWAPQHTVEDALRGLWEEARERAAAAAEDAP